MFSAKLPQTRVCLGAGGVGMLREYWSVALQDGGSCTTTTGGGFACTGDHDKKKQAETPNAYF